MSPARWSSNLRSKLSCTACATFCPAVVAFMAPISTFLAVMETLCISSTSIEKRTPPPSKLALKFRELARPAQALEQQKAVFLPDVSQEMLRHPELAPFAAESVGRATYVFPLFTSQQRYGILAVTKERGQEFVTRGCRTAALSGIARCGRARMRAGEGQRRALPATSGERARSAQAVAGDQQPHRFQAGH